MEYFSDKVDEFDPSGTLTYCFFFDGAANVQKVGAILCAKYPRAMSFHGGEHVLSLFFSDLAKINPIRVSLNFLWNSFFQYLTFSQRLVLKTCRLYNIFGSGANHAIHAIFMDQAAAINGNQRIGLLRGAGTRFATLFYAMHRLLRQKRALKATIHSPAFSRVALFKILKMKSSGSQFTVFWECFPHFESFTILWC